MNRNKNKKLITKKLQMLFQQNLTLSEILNEIENIKKVHTLSQII